MDIKTKKQITEEFAKDCQDLERQIKQSYIMIRMVHVDIEPITFQPLV